jgi:hypothetical protein
MFAAVRRRNDSIAAALTKAARQIEREFLA